MVFGFGPAAARKRRLRAAFIGMPELLEALHPSERAAVLLLTNAQLDLVARTHGAELTSDPRNKPELAASVIEELLLLHAQWSATADIAPRDVVRYLRAHVASLLVAALTLSMGVDARNFRPMIAATWKTLWSTRSRNEHALAWLRRGESATGAPCFPPPITGTGHVSDITALGFGTRLPVFLTPRRKPAEKSASSATKG